ncbi:hypothetical protein A2U01_0090537, partial [Trifolium medium]|nr:hypothetical protein [Trifolium medium]
MSLKSDTTALDEPKRDWSKPKRMKPPPPPLPTWMKPKSKGPIPISEEYRQIVLRECYKGVE